MQSRDFAAAYLIEKSSLRRLRRRSDDFGLGFRRHKVAIFRGAQSPSGGRPGRLRQSLAVSELLLVLSTALR